MAEISVHLADMLAWLAGYDGPQFDSCVTDPPYHLASIVKRFSAKDAAPVKPGKTGAYARASRGFMGKEWDGGDIAFRAETWAAVFAVLKPGAHLVAFSGTRTYHRMACAIEDAGFEIRDQLAWTYGSGFPKSHDVSKAIDKAAGAERKKVKRSRVDGKPTGVDGGWKNSGCDVSLTSGPPVTPDAEQWQGWGTALKPAWEPICLARKPLAERSVAANVLAHGTGGLNIDGCRIEGEAWARPGSNAVGGVYGDFANDGPRTNDKGRFPANILHDGSPEVLAGFPDTREGGFPASRGAGGIGNDGHAGQDGLTPGRADAGSAARFFYSAKAGPLDRIGSSHATVKPVDLMRWLARLITPPGGLILDPFAGSGTTGIAAMAEGFGCQMLDIEAEHVADIERKLAFLRGQGATRVAEHKRGSRDAAEPDHGPLFNPPK